MPSIPKFCSVCGERRRSLILDTKTGTIICFDCVGSEAAPALVIQDPRDYDELDLTDENRELLADAGVSPGFSVVELLFVVALMLTLSVIFIPTVVAALHSIREIMALVDQVQVH